ncbi:MAG: hypothetical protein A3E87_07005 [Gammaproteobacteria bacterium RIFCSPHIGHO2_12_FULL_35_23]|nr:MAG: hypothetical protein A3E87_07005 [Gammaproteobacteria bacterium RIFCSPHIGHO2_12_FULL_35_23]
MKTEQQKIIRTLVKKSKKISLINVCNFFNQLPKPIQTFLAPYIRYELFGNSLTVEPGNPDCFEYLLARRASVETVLLSQELDLMEYYELTLEFQLMRATEQLQRSA